jgi:hypothetical protein
MRHALLAAALPLFVLACVEVPASIHAEFAGPGPSDPSNYRPGRHGTAPAVDGPAAKESPSVDADAAPAAMTSDDGGVS